MNKLNIVLTGVTSFSGAHFTYELLASGHNVVGFSRNLHNWSREENSRISWIKEKYPNFKIFSLDNISKIKSKEFQLLCLHGAYVENYQSPEFDVNFAVDKTLEVTNILAEIFPSANIFHTGTFSEPNESSGNFPRLSFNPYSESKSIVWEKLKTHLKERRISKYIMPNPFGPLESKRFTDYMLRCWGQNQAAVVNFPFHVRDNVPIDLLRKHYARSIEMFSESILSTMHFYPSMYPESIQTFAQRYKQQLEARSNSEFPLQFNLESKYTEPIVRVNSENCRILVKDWDENKSWDVIAEDAINRIANYSRLIP